MTQLEINKAILEKAQAVKEQEVNLKVAKLKLDKKLAELGDGNVYAEFDGTVKAVRDPDEAYNNSEAVVELSRRRAVTTSPAPSARWIWAACRWATAYPSAAG